MGDDIRDRFRGVRTDYSAPLRPIKKPVQSKPNQMFGQNSYNPPNPKLPQPMPAPVAKAKTSKRNTKKYLIALILIILLVPSSAAGLYFYKKQMASKNTTPKAQSQSNTFASTPKPTGTITFMATGDFLAYDSVNSAAKNGESYDYSKIMAPIKPVFDKFDMRFCNQATLGAGVSLGVSGYPTFNAPTEWSKGLEGLGCNIINVGSSHTNDKGPDAIKSALDYYDKNSNILAIAGANRSPEEQNKIRYFTLKQAKFAFLSFTTSSQKPPAQPFSINLYNADSAKKSVEEAKKNSQFVIVAMNWGKEDSGEVQPEQSTIAQALTDAGADLILGNGPHVVQPAKIFDGKDGHQSLVWFSLGNAVNSQLQADNLFGGIGIVDIDVATLHMTNPRFLPTYMHYEWTAEQKRKPDLTARKNLTWYPLDIAKEALAASQNGTTIEAQTARLTAIITKLAPVKVIKSTDL